MRSRQLYWMLIAKEINTQLDFPNADSVLTTQIANRERIENYVLNILRTIYAEIQSHIYDGNSDTFITITFDGDESSEKALDEVSKILHGKGFKCQLGISYFDGCGDLKRGVKVSWTPVKKRK